MNNKSLKKNFMMNVILTLSSFIYPVITFPYVSRILTPEGTGKIAFATSYVSYFLMISQLGIPTYGIRACAQVRDNKYVLSKTVHELFFINIIMSAVSYVFLFLSIALIPTIRVEKNLILVISTTILLNSIGIEWLYKGLELYSYITIRSVVFKIVALVCMFIFVHSYNDYIIYGAITVVASSASFIFNFIHAKKYIIFKWLKGYAVNSHIRNIITFFAMAFATTIYTNLDAVMLGFMTSDADVGYYNAAVKIKTVLVALVSALGAVLLPRSSYLIEHNRIDEFKNISFKALKFVLLFSFPLMLYFMLFAEEGIVFLSGDAYMNSILPMQIIMPTIVLIGITNIMGIQILVPLGKEKIVLKSVIIGAIVDLIINLILIPNLKSTGAAIGTLVAEATVFIVQYLYLRTEIHSVFRSYSWRRLLIALVFSAIASIWVKLLEVGVLLSLVISGFSFFIVYFGYMYKKKDRITCDMFELLYRKLHKQ